MATQALQLLLSSLHTQGANEVQILESISVEWASLRKANIDCADLLKGNILFLSLAKVLEAKFEVWKVSFPSWINNLLYEFERERQKATIFQLDQTRALISALRIYVMNGSWDCLFALSCLSGSYIAKQILLQDDELYNILKKQIHRPNTLRFFGGFSSSTNASTQKKMLEDAELISSLLKLLESDVEDAWKVIDNVTTHSDAKTLLPKKEIIRLANKSKREWPRLCTLLCSDEDLLDLKLNVKWIEDQVPMLKSVLSCGRAEHEGRGYSLLGIILPIANLAIAESYKGKLAEAIAPLLRVVIDENLPDAFNVQTNLSRSRQEASRAVWNLAYLESNCTLIKEIDGIAKLKKEWQITEDSILKKNIEGILYMCKAPVETSLLEKTISNASSKHVMISYNWGNQPIVQKIAQSLKEQGYNVWLDLEQMGGSTLEAMALAVEHAEVVLMCVSQKYQDSPNCRLEGEYCVKRKVMVVPLKMQSGYTPDGWLGITLGTKFYYDFSDDTNWETKMRKLVKAIGDRGKVGTCSTSLPSDAIVATKVTHIEKWNTEDMLKWMKAEQIEHHFDTFIKHKMNGRALVELKSQGPWNPFYFRKFCKQMGICEMGEILNLSAAIRKL